MCCLIKRAAYDLLLSVLKDIPLVSDQGTNI